MKMNLESIVLRQSDDEVKTDLEVVCTECGAHLCDAEHDDTLTVLVDAALDHQATCPKRDATTPPPEFGPGVSLPPHAALTLAPADDPTSPHPPQVGPLQQHERAAFDYLKQAFGQETVDPAVEVALMRVSHDGFDRAVVVVIATPPEETETRVTPIALLMDTALFEAMTPPPFEPPNS